MILTRIYVPNKRLSTPHKHSTLILNSQVPFGAILHPYLGNKVFMTCIAFICPESSIPYARLRSSQYMVTLTVVPFCNSTYAVFGLDDILSDRITVVKKAWMRDLRWDVILKTRQTRTLSIYYTRGLTGVTLNKLERVQVACPPCPPSYLVSSVI